MKRRPPLASWILGLALLGCASPVPEPEDEVVATAAWQQGATAVARGAARGASAVGSSIGTAYRGMRDGFEEPDAATFGSYPRDYVDRIRAHMVRFEGVPREASFRFRPPQKGFINRGILRGGGIEWQGYLVDVDVGTRRFTGQRNEKGYVVRLRDGEVIEVHDRAHASALRRVSQPSAAAAPASD